MPRRRGRGRSGASNGGVGGWFAILAAAALVAAGFSGISNGIALLTRQEVTMIAIADVIGLPLLLFSSILIASSLLPGWMRALSLLDPVEWAAHAARNVAIAGSDAAEISLYLGLLLGFNAVTGASATWSFRIYQRTV
jgi:ABC-2 type transport system permease protein